MEKQQVSGYSDGPGSAHWKTVGLAYAGSNPAPATQNPRSGPVQVLPDAGPAACPERFGRPFPVAVGQLWARSGLVSGLRRSGPGAGRPGGVSVRRTSWAGVPAGHGRVSGADLAYRVQRCPTASSCDTDA